MSDIKLCPLSLYSEVLGLELCLLPAILKARENNVSEIGQGETLFCSLYANAETTVSPRVSSGM
jgi:hypothetical protein